MLLMVPGLRRDGAFLACGKGAQPPPHPAGRGRQSQGSHGKGSLRRRPRARGAGPRPPGAGHLLAAFSHLSPGLRPPTPRSAASSLGPRGLARPGLDHRPAGGQQEREARQPRGEAAAHPPVRDAGAFWFSPGCGNNQPSVSRATGQATCHGPSAHEASQVPLAAAFCCHSTGTT